MRGATSPFAVVLRLVAVCAVTIGMSVTTAHGQKMSGATASRAPTQSEADAWKDPLGRSTPRGTVTGFLDAARAGNHEVARQYLNASDARAETLAGQLFVVLDARLPARLTRISDVPEGSVSTLRTPTQEIVGTIAGGRGPVPIVLERVSRGDPAPIWLFSERTLDSVPALYAEIAASRRNAVLPEFLTRTRIGGIRLADSLAIVLGLPLIYLATILLNRALTPLLRVLWRRAFPGPDANRRNVLPAPARLLLVTAAGGWLVSALPMSLAMRQLWSNVASLVTIGAVTWLLILLNGEIERHIQRRVAPANVGAAAALLRLLRRGVDVLIVFAAMIVMLRHFGINPAPALAGLGVGGIAVALAAQKTLENVIAGASLIFDQAVRVGDVLKFGEVVGTVDHIGLRSTRIRTFDRTVVSIPNGQIANASLETLSSRDKFWFHPIVGLRYETTPDQLHRIVDGITQLLHEHPAIDVESVRVRFFRLGAFSLDVEVFAYLLARDWNHFLEIQQQLLFDVTYVVSRAGASIALPSQTMYVDHTPAAR